MALGMKVIGELLFSGGLIFAAKFLTSEDNGYLQVSVSAAMLMAPLAVMGLGNHIIKANPSATDLGQLLVNSFFLVFCISVPLSVISLYFLGQLDFLSLLGLAFLWGSMILMRDVFRARGEGFYSDLGFQLVKGFGVWGVIYIAVFTEVAVVFLVLALLAIIIILDIFVLRFIKKVSLSGAVNFNEAIKLMKDAGSLGAAGAAKLALDRVDIIIVASLSSISQAGAYAVISRISNVPAIAIEPIRNVLRPYFASTSKEKALKYRDLATFSGFVISALFVFAVYFGGQHALSYLEIDEHNLYWPLLVLVVSKSIANIFSISGSLLVMRGKEKSFMWVMVASLVSLLILNSIFVETIQGFVVLYSSIIAISGFCVFFVSRRVE
ncbi:hypothetical protein [Marinobacter sp. Hex_13]|uniref:lipopolysaccharide biosynthesis protein n=1 Tax=Marinobacter sp. Hex_13 TaxID=1795866 RepID=UPI00257ED5D4|nr:hypothetical protein [Marinobacter sp. Hex_13]